MSNSWFGPRRRRVAIVVAIAGIAAIGTLVAMRTHAGFGPPQAFDDDAEATVATPLRLPLAPPSRAAITPPHAFAIGPTRRVDAALAGEQGWEPSIVVAHADPAGVAQDEIVVMWTDARAAGNFSDTRAGFARSTDGGNTWATSDFPQPSQSVGIPFDPMTAFDVRSGKAYVGAMSRVSSGVDTVWIAGKNAGAQNFAAPAIAHAQAGVDKGWMAAGPLPAPSNGSALYLTYNFGVQRSVDGGATFGALLPLSGWVGYQPRVAPDGTLTISYIDNNAQAILVKSTDGLQTLSEPMVVAQFAAGPGALSQAAAGDYRMAPFVMHCVDPSSGRIYVILNDVTQTVDGQADINLLLRDSNDGGQTWSAPRIVNGDGTPPGDQVMPWIECDAQGRLHIAYFDNRRNPTPDAAASTLLDVYYAMSSDGGHTWQETRLTSTPLDTANSNWSPYGVPTQFVGDYIGIALSRNAAYVAYPGAASNGVALMVTRIDFGDRIFADGFD